MGQVTGPSVPRIWQRYGSWTAACEAAGVEPGRTVRSNYESRWSDHDIADIVRLYLLDPNAPNSAKWIRRVETSERARWPVIPDRAKPFRFMDRG